jgi:UDP-glucose 4-epimerase
MRVLVTGGAGFIGSHLVEHLVAAGQEVVVLDDLSSGRREHFAAVRRRISFIRGSVTELSLCRRAVAGADVVLHLAAVTSHAGSVEAPLATHGANASGTLNILVAAREARVRRVVFASSMSVYGNSATLPNAETHVPRPLDPYAAAKLAGEAYCLVFHATYGLETVVLRYFNVFGPRQDPTSPYAAVVPRFIAAALQGERPTIYGDGKQTRDFVYVADVVHANLLACQAPAAHVAGQVFNIGSGRSVSVNELWERIAALTAVPVLPRYGEGRPGDVKNSLAAIDKARERLGYTPAVEFDEGLRRMVTFVRERRRTQRRRGMRSVLPATRRAAGPPP